MHSQDFRIKRRFLLSLGLLAAFVVSASIPASAISSEKKTRGEGYIGILMQDLTEELLEGLDTSVKKGILVSGVMEGSPAEEAGLEEGDIIVEFDGTEVTSSKELKRLVLGADTGDQVKFKVIRDDEAKVIRLVVGERPEREERSLFMVSPRHLGYKFHNASDAFVYACEPTGRLGVEVRDLDEKLGSYFKVGEGEGVLVLGVREDTPAHEAGIEAGDVIVSVAGDEISSVEELVDAVRDLEKGEKVEVTLVRHGKKKTLTATMKEIDIDSPHVYIYGHDPKRSFRWYGPHDDLMDMHIGDIDIEKHMKHYKLDKYEFRKEMQELKKELKEMKQELEKLKGE